MVGAVQLQLQGLGAALKDVDKKFASTVRKKIRDAVTETGSEIVNKIKAEASWSTGRTSTRKHPHTSIPDAIYIRPNFSTRSAGISIIANRRKAPHAGLFELGNKDGEPGPGTFTNGTDGTVTKRPFFYNSATRAAPELERKFLDAINEAARDAGFH